MKYLALPMKTDDEQKTVVNFVRQNLASGHEFSLAFGSGEVLIEGGEMPIIEPSQLDTKLEGPLTHEQIDELIAMLTTLKDQEPDEVYELSIPMGDEVIERFPEMKDKLMAGWRVIITNHL